MGFLISLENAQNPFYDFFLESIDFGLGLSEYVTNQINSGGSESGQLVVHLVKWAPNLEEAEKVSLI